MNLISSIMNRYDILVIIGLIVIIISPFVVVVYRFIEPPIPLVFHIGVWPVAISHVISYSVAASFSFAWVVLSLVQALNTANATRRRYRLLFAWVIFVFTVVAQYVIITEFLVPQVGLIGDARHSVEVNIFPQMVLNSGLVFLSLSRLIGHSVANTSEATGI